MDIIEHWILYVTVYENLENIPTPNKKKKT